MFGQLKRYCEVDEEKLRLLENLRPVLQSKKLYLSDFSSERHILCKMDIEDKMESLQSLEVEFRICPNCGRRFPEGETFCPHCVVALKDIPESADIRSIVTSPEITCIGLNNFKSFDDLLSDDNFALVNGFDFTIKDFNNIVHDIRLQGFKNLDKLIKDNDIDLNDLEILDKVLLFTKSFVTVEYKSYGANLGYFEYNKIHVDDRQRKSLQITTLIHELTHFLVKEILTHVLCDIINANKNSYVESFVTYILSSSVFNNLVDEYAAHTVEGRFTMFGYQDYSSFVALQGDLDDEHVDIAKMIGNTFSIHIKDLLESFIDWDLRQEIKDQFLSDTIEGPDYRQLAFESCNRLSDEGFLKAIWLILTEGFENVDLELLNQYRKEFKN